MTQAKPSRPSDRTRARLFRAAGVTIILLGACSALLPILGRSSRPWVVGSLLLAAGLIELLVGTLRNETRIPAMLAGGVTMLAGLMFTANPTGRFVPTVTIVTAWLLARSAVLLVASRLAHGSVRTWLSLSAATDCVLGVVLLAGISIATLVVTLFGPTPGLVASFAWVLALSFAVTGLLMLEVASCEREAAER